MPTTRSRRHPRRQRAVNDPLGTPLLASGALSAFILPLCAFPPRSPMIEISDLSMNYGPVRALDGLSLSIPQGEFFAFLGPNGAGKTTAIKLLTGLMKPLRGSVKLSGFDVQMEPLQAKAVLGYVPDVAVFYEKLTS